MVVAAAVVWAIGVLTAERVVGGALLDFLVCWVVLCGLTRCGFRCSCDGRVESTGVVWLLIVSIRLLMFRLCVHFGDLVVGCDARSL